MKLMWFLLMISCAESAANMPAVRLRDENAAIQFGTTNPVVVSKSGEGLTVSGSLFVGSQNVTEEISMLKARVAQLEQVSGTASQTSTSPVAFGAPPLPPPPPAPPPPPVAVATNIITGFMDGGIGGRVLASSTHAVVYDSKSLWGSGDESNYADSSWLLYSPEGSFEAYVFNTDAAGNMPAVTNATASATAIIQGTGQLLSAELSTSHLVLAHRNSTTRIGSNYPEVNYKVHVHTIDNSGNIPMTATTTIESSGYDSQDRFAPVMALSTSHLVIMWSSASSSGSDKKLYIFNFDGSGNVPATSTAAVEPPDNTFGTAIALSTSHLVVGSHGWDSATGSSNHGKVYIYKIDGSGNIPLTPTAIIEAAAHQSTRAHFGDYGLALSASHLLVGTRASEMEPGGTRWIPSSEGARAFIFKMDGSGDIPTSATGILDTSQWPYPGSSIFGDSNVGTSMLSSSHLVQNNFDGKLCIYKKDASGNFPTDPFSAVLTLGQTTQQGTANFSPAASLNPATSDRSWQYITWLGDTTLLAYESGSLHVFQSNT